MNTSRAWIFVVAMFLVSCATIPPRAQNGHFKILQINDVYKIEGLEGGQSGGLARVRSLRKLLESDGTPVLVLHAGDALYPSVMSKYLEAKPMLEILNLLDGDPAKTDPHLIITFGNHEYDKSDPTVLLDRLKESAFVWVSTNSRWCHPTCDQRFPNTTDLYIADVGGTRVGIIGLIYPLKKTWVESTDVITAARDAVSALAGQGVSVIVALTHEDMGQDVELVRQVPGIDLVIGGHDHLFMQQQVEGKWISKADADAKSAIVYDVTVPPQGPIVTTPLRIALDTTMPKDPVIDQAVQRWMGVLSAKLGGNATIGQTENLLEGVEPAVRGRETALGNLLTDAAREQMQTDVAILNGGSIRINDNIPPGPVTSYDMEGIFYYTNTLVAMRVTGQHILDMLRNSVSRADAGDGRFLQVSGLSFIYGNDLTVQPADVTIGGRPLDLTATYSLATIDYVYLNGPDDGYTLFAEATRPPKINTDREADFRKTVEAYIRTRGTVDTKIEGRIARRP
ncbi:MAG: bifunctional UDP-sugar hydrolase/5'-nucleotidase [Acidobacteriota bacterium]